ncbi:hypothetical protein GE09DRAFT_708409 [Coniochaeta sp. 2T2.1]|nr:hypothetical protein GE09DRAFT_708409 [Coniochaeta sp. 2T2.1]
MEQADTQELWTEAPIGNPTLYTPLSIAEAGSPTCYPPCTHYISVANRVLRVLCRSVRRIALFLSSLISRLETALIFNLGTTYLYLHRGWPAGVAGSRDCDSHGGCVAVRFACTVIDLVLLLSEIFQKHTADIVPGTSLLVMFAVRLLVSRLTFRFDCGGKGRGRFNQMMPAHHIMCSSDLILRPRPSIGVSRRDSLLASSVLVLSIGVSHATTTSETGPMFVDGPTKAISGPRKFERTCR